MVVPTALFALALALNSPGAQEAIASGHDAAHLVTEVWLQANGPGDRSEFGISAVGGGDFNADGLEDLAVGAPTGPNFAGVIHVYLGGRRANAAADILLPSQFSSDLYGRAVAWSDVNGDGFDDLIVGAPNFLSGRIVIFLGGKNPDAAPDAQYERGFELALFGFSVAGVGDFDGDGYEDFVVGSPADRIPGHAYLYFGGPDVRALESVELLPEGDVDNFGFAVAGGRDVDGDGRNDILVGAPGSIQLGPGTAHVFFAAGGTMSLTAGAPGDQFGFGVAFTGDLDGDGRPDLAIGAPREDDEGFHAGRVYVYSGTGELLQTLKGFANRRFGESIASPGDFTGDGVDDLFIGLPTVSSRPGEVMLYSGARIADPDAGPVRTFTLGSPTDAFGATVVAGGNLLGDGSPTIVMGAPRRLDGSLRKGTVQVLVPRRPRLMSPDGGDAWFAGEKESVTWEGSDTVDVALSTDNGVSWSTLIGQVGGADTNSVVVTVPNVITTTARVRVARSGEPPLTVNSDASTRALRVARQPVRARAVHRMGAAVEGGSPGGLLGFSIAARGDYDRDGRPDIAAGAPLAAHAGGETGRVTVRRSAAGPLQLNGTQAGEGFGAAVHWVHDLDGDGWDHLLVGAPGHDGGSGRVYVHSGDSGSGARRLIAGAADARGFGGAFASGFDSNGDGFADLAIGAPGAGAADTGRVYVFFCGPPFDLTPDVVLSSSFAGDRFGAALQALDLNRDGAIDLAVGAPVRAAQAPGAEAPGAGAVDVYFGGATMDSKRDLMLEGSQRFEAFGAALSAADLDHDGADDLVVGAPAADAPGADAGRVRVFKGGAALDATPDLVVAGTQPGARLGSALACPGDVNGDGIADLAIGAPFVSGPSGDGEVQIILGHPRLSANPEFVFRGGPGARFGHALAAGGDANGDGLADVVAGSPFADAVGADAGRADRIDFARYFLLSPNGGEVWPVGSLQTITWRGEEPAEVQLSTDGGLTFAFLADARVRNTVEVRVPKSASRRAVVRLVPFDPRVRGGDRSDAEFEIRAAVSLLHFDARLDPDGARLTWRTDPGPSPSGIHGYRVYRRDPGAGAPWVRVGPDIVVGREMFDRDARPRSTYRLVAVNGFNDEVAVGERALAGIRGLALRPMPMRSGGMTIEFEAPAGAAGFTAFDLEVEVYDVSGRRVALLARGPIPAATGIVRIEWDGILGHGVRASPGMYTMRARSESAGFALARTFAVLR